MNYHFLSSTNALDDLENNRIKVSTIDSLNDPFEFMPYRRYKFPERQPYNEMFRAVSKKWGILCFSKSCEEQLLWAHYGEKHQGVALGFEIPDNKLLEVSYTHDITRSKFELTDDSNENEQMFLGLAKTKFVEWEYEKEYRLLILLSNCVKKEKHYFVNFGNELKIKEIILGCRFDHNKYRTKIMDLANRLGASVIATREGWEDYRIHFDGTKSDWYKQEQG